MFSIPHRNKIKLVTRYNPMVEERPVVLWIETGMGLLRHHSYHTFLELHLRQK